MATKPLKTITFEGLEDTYTIPQIDDTLSVTGASADAKATGDSLKAKAEAEGAVSMAKALVGGKYTIDQSPYHYRQSPDAGSLDEKIVGGTLGWNQKFNIAQIISGVSTMTITRSGNELILDGTCEGNELRTTWWNVSSSINHVYIGVLTGLTNAITELHSSGVKDTIRDYSKGTSI